MVLRSSSTIVVYLYHHLYRLSTASLPPLYRLSITSTALLRPLYLMSHPLRPPPLPQCLQSPLFLLCDLTTRPCGILLGLSLGIPPEALDHVLHLYSDPLSSLQNCHNPVLII